MVKKRYNASGDEITDSEDAALENDEIRIKKTKKAFYERGRGPAYQKTIYKTCMNTGGGSPDEDGGRLREYEDDPLDINILPDGGVIHYKKNTKNLFLEAGRGPAYQKTKLKFCNNDDNTTRDVRTQRVPRDENGDNNGNFIEVERIIHFQVETGRGPAYQRKRVNPCNDEDELYEDIRVM